MGLLLSFRYFCEEFVQILFDVLYPMPCPFTKHAVIPFRYGCPSMEEIENYNSIYKKRLEEIGQSGEVPDDLGVEVTS